MRNDDANGPSTKGHCLYGSDKWPCQSHDTRSPHQYARCWIPFSRTNLFIFFYGPNMSELSTACLGTDFPNLTCQSLCQTVSRCFKDMQQLATSIQSPGPVLESGSLATGTANLQSERPKESKGSKASLQHLGSHWMKHVF